MNPRPADYEPVEHHRLLPISFFLSTLEQRLGRATLLTKHQLLKRQRDDAAVEVGFKGKVETFKKRGVRDHIFSRRRKPSQVATESRL